MHYPKEQKSKLIALMLPPASQAVATLSREHGVPENTLYNWRMKAQQGANLVTGKNGNAEQWPSRVKFSVVLETAALNETELGHYCRTKGLFPEQVQAWRQSSEQACGKPHALPQKAERQRIRELEKELLRKERALAETAALLVLRKKLVAIWGEQEDV